MTKRIIIIAVWTVAFMFGSAMLLGFVSGVIFAAQTFHGGHISEQTTSIVGLSWATVPMMVGAIGLLLGFFGKLPGTRRWSGTAAK